jgi:hypothetical protein
VSWLESQQAMSGQCIDQLDQVSFQPVRLNIVFIQQSQESRLNRRVRGKHLPHARTNFIQVASLAGDEIENDGFAI